MEVRNNTQCTLRFDASAAFDMIRDFRIGDEPRLWHVFHSSIHTLAVGDYTREQRLAWAPDERNAELEERWNARMQTIRPFVMERDGEIVGYADLQPDGYIDHFFVAGAHARSGVGSALMQWILASARERDLDHLTSDVSLTAQPFFRRFGFVTVEEREVAVRGIALVNAAMRLEPVPPDGG